MKRVMITGANRGIGLEHVRRYAAAGAEVLAAVRDPAQADELSALARAEPRITVFAYDAADPAAPEAARQALGDRTLDLLFCNAGVYGGPAQSLGGVDPDAFLETIRVNTLAPLLLAEALAGAVAASDRRLIALQSSKMGSIADNTSGGYYAYRASKAALNMVARSLAQDLAPRGVTVVTLHPGWVKTRMGGPSAPMEVAQSVAGQQTLLGSLGPDRNGRFFNFDGDELSW